MNIVKFILGFSLLFVNGLMVAQAQNKVVVVPSGDSDFSMTVVPSEPEPEPEPEPAPTNSGFLDEAIPKRIVWNKGWDVTIGNRTKIDPSVQISFSGISKAPFGIYNAIYYSPGPEIRQWGEQRHFVSSKKIYSKSVLLIDKGETVEGGPFEWTLNKQNFVSLGNIVTRDFVKHPQGWIKTWDDPKSGEKVWFFLMSDDERFSSNPVTFIWP